MIVASASRAFQHALESGHFKGTLAQAASRAWGSIAAHGLVKRLVLRDDVRVIAVGGSTLGGSGKTPVAIAWARREAKAGTRVALIGHAYGARPGHARIVSKNDDVREVGDEALVCARALEGVTDVVVAPSRQTAAEFAVAHGARILVLDGVAQISPRRADVALLVRHDENRLRACPPAGDLRAPISALRALADFVVVVSDEESPQIASGEIAARVVSEHAYAPNGDVISFSELAKMRVGVALSIAHPERVLRMLARRGVVPLACATVRDHRGDDLRRAMTRVSRRDGAIEVWLISDKCASFVAPTSHDTIPIYVIAHRAELRGGGVS